MSYTLYTDKSDNFNCKIELEGASHKNSFSRLILETDEFSMIFKGKIDENGNCSIPINNLKHVFKSSCKGSLQLEVIADDTYFCPWKDSADIKPSKSITVESISLGSQTAQKKRVSITEIKTDSEYGDLVKLFKEVGINKDILQKNPTKRQLMESVAKKYFSDIGKEYSNADGDKIVSFL